MKEYMMSDFNAFKSALLQFKNEEINYLALKKFSAKFGFYQQKNKKFMVRIRITAGDITLSQLEAISQVMDENNIEYCRISTRQAIQLHNVEVDSVINTVDSLIAKGFIFRGGGGDTFRNIAVSIDSGISKNSIFDVIPYAKACTEFIYPIEDAFALPRKIKISFSSDQNDGGFAKWNDLGFIAKIKDGVQGFEVYIAGGMGRESIPAIKYSDFVPTEDCFKYCKAMITLFSEHGDRSNRSKARIRFIRKRLGDNEFISLFEEYLNAEKNIEKCTIQSEANCIDIENSELLRVPLFQGNLYQDDIKHFIESIKSYNPKAIRLSRVHEIYLLINKIDCSELKQKLEGYPKNTFNFNKLEGNILSCTGATVCGPGHCDSMYYALELGKYLDSYLPSEVVNEHINKIRELISISGCPNCCSNLNAFGIGISLSKGKVDGVIQDKTKVTLAKEIADKINSETINEMVASELNEFICGVLLDLFK